jgi:hypothetical protein
MSIVNNHQPGQATSVHHIIATGHDEVPRPAKRPMSASHVFAFDAVAMYAFVMAVFPWSEATIRGPENPRCLHGALFRLVDVFRTTNVHHQPALPMFKLLLAEMTRAGVDGSDAWEFRFHIGATDPVTDPGYRAATWMQNVVATYVDTKAGGGRLAGRFVFVPLFVARALTGLFRYATIRVHDGVEPRADRELALKTDLVLGVHDVPDDFFVKWDGDRARAALARDPIARRAFALADLRARFPEWNWAYSRTRSHVLVAVRGKRTWVVEIHQSSWVSGWSETGSATHHSDQIQWSSAIGVDETQAVSAIHALPAPAHAYVVHRAASLTDMLEQLKSKAVSAYVDAVAAATTFDVGDVAATAARAAGYDV